MSDRPTRRNDEPRKDSGYYPSGGYDEGFPYGQHINGAYSATEWRDGRIVEFGDDDLDDVPDGMQELRELKRRGVPGYR